VATAVLEKSRRRLRRRKRIRGKVAGTAQRPRLSIYRSNRGLFAQLIDDERGHTIASVSWTEKDLRGCKPMEQAAKAGELMAERARGAGLEACIFDRGGYRYHGLVRAFDDGARGGGLRF
jgi:large subunit ribosomal protein L18